MRKKLFQFSLELVGFSKSSHAALLLSIEILIGIFAVTGSLYIFLKLARNVLEKETMSFDSILMQAIYTMRSPFLTSLMNILTFFGGEIFLTIAILVTIFLLLRKHRKDALVFGFILALGIGLNLILKMVFQRARPDLHPLIHESSYSFPSGHAMNAFIFYTCVSFFIFRRLHNKRLGKILITLSILLVLLIGISRIYLGVHYPSDVLAGFSGGLLWFVTVLLFEKTLVFLRLFKTYELNKKY